MKKLIVFVFFTLVFSVLLNAIDSIPNPDSPAYDAYKKSLTYIPREEPVVANVPITYTALSREGLLIPLDGSFSMILAGNDDSYSTIQSLPFTFNLYGTNYTSFYVNNNGNVSFGGAYSDYTSTGFPVNGFPMLAPFWADVDTRPAASGKVWVRIQPHQVTVIWDHVGYYGNQVDKLNTFELIFTDGTDPIIGIGNNVAFSYADMQWTTGSASGGSGGFGGTPASVGINKGDGVYYALIGRFNHAGTDYDGPGGIADGVSYLDNQCFQFVTSLGNNIPPVFNGIPSTVDLFIGDEQSINITAIGPENNQTVYSTVTTNMPEGINYEVTPGNPCQIDIDIQGLISNVGSYVVNLTAYDNGTPVYTSLGSFTINILNRAPVITSQPVTSLLEDDHYLYVITITDPDELYGDGISSVQFLSAPPGMTYNNIEHRVEWLPTNNDVEVS